MFEIYNLVLVISAVFFSPIAALAFIIKPKFRAGFWQKIGFYKKPQWDTQTEKTIWLHAVSVGEINATEALIKRIKADYPQHKLIVSTITVTGQEIARKKLSNTADLIIYFPYDFKFSVNSALRTYNPSLIIIAETEIWPGFINQAHKRKIPVMLVNGRISPGSFKGYKKIKLLFQHVLEKFSLILMQTETDRERILYMGANPEKTHIMGNLKFDIAPALDLQAIHNLNDEYKSEDCRVLTAGSTHSGEDEIILNVFNKLKDEFSDLKLIIAPRHPERNDFVKNLIAKCGYGYGLRSKNENFSRNDILLLDVMGELSKIYSISYISFIGGSFSGTGGHNPLESAIYGVPVISGPTVFNFNDIYKFMTAQGSAKIVQNEQELYNQIKLFLINTENYQQAQRACSEIFEKNKGALDYTMKQIGNYL